MLRRLRQLVLVLLSAVLVMLPYTEHACNWDRFPTASNDLELQIVCCLCVIGMFLVFARQSRFSPQAFRSAFIFGSVPSGSSREYEAHELLLPFLKSTQLRI